MTAQISDPFKYRGRFYDIAGKNGTGLFDPARHEMTPVACCSACWNGFVCTYSVKRKQLLLDELGIWLEEPAPILFGVEPRGDTFFGAVYENLRHPVKYSGGLLLGRNFIDELYVHMGFHPAWKYSEVHELIFDEGKLIHESDCSEKVAELRRKLIEEPLRPEPGTDMQNLMRWINECFSQEYKW